MAQQLPNKIVAAFDFDGTLTYRDTLLPFLVFNVGWRATITKLISVSPSLVRYVLGKMTRQEVKEDVIAAFFKGLPLDHLRHKGEEFAHTKLDALTIPDGIQRLRWHQKAGHHTILISANLEAYLKPWAK